MKLAIIAAHYGAECALECLSYWGNGIYMMDGSNGILPAYQRGFEVAVGEDILAYVHDDVICHEVDWKERVLAEFSDPQVGLVGFGGALSHGSPNLYRDPYHYSQLGRGRFLSNMTDAEVHGERFTGACDAAVLDGFSLIVRREVLEKAGGWPVGKLDYVGYDYWLCCMTRRLGYRIRVLGVFCTHLGGRTYVAKGIGDRPEAKQEFLDAHQYIYETFKDCLPFKVNQ